MSLGDYTAGDVLYRSFTTVDSTGAPASLTGGTVRAYDQDNTTEISTGITLTADFDGKTGLNMVKVDTSSGYTSGHMFNLVITAGTVSGTSVVGYEIDSFSIGMGGAAAGVSWDDPYAAHVGAGTFGLLMNQLSKVAVTVATDLEPASIFDQIMNKNASQTYSQTTDSLEAGIDAAPTLAQLVTANWAALRSANTTAGSFGEGIASVQGNITGTVGGVATEVTPVAADGFTFTQAMTLIVAALGGKAVANPAGTQVQYYDRSNNLLATVTNPTKGNRTATYP